MPAGNPWKNIVPIPPELAALPTIEAEPWLKVDPNPEMFIEGPAFDRDGNFFFTSPSHGSVFKVTAPDKVTAIFSKKDVRPDGSAFHRDGRLFVVCLSGELLAMNADGGDLNIMHPKYDGKSLTMNDLVFDARGNIYVTDCTGSPMDPTGGVFRLSSDANTVQLVLRHMTSPNGISLTPEGNTLWVAETSRNTMVIIRLMPDGITVAPPAGVSYPYYFTGTGGPDSNKIDREGNLYQTIILQGRIVVFNAYGIPVANVIIPGREEGKHLRTNNLAFKPGTREGYITTSGTEGAWIYKFTGLAEGLPLYSHQ